ncbi:MAG: glutathione S-transferase family protein [Alphaproteobacteria bacterium]|nr:glutathione S-transferase family protein [Alphaproteobacteria bacterium]
MILIGQFDSPFVRRVGIALKLYGLPFEHRPWSTFGEADKIRAYNPLLRVPTLVLLDGDVLIESHAILDYVDSLVPAGKRLYPVAEPDRHRAIKVAALATGFADKAVSLFYEKVLHDKASTTIDTRWRDQIGGALNALEADRASRTTQYWFGGAIGHADIAVACALRHARDAHPGLIPFDRLPALAAHSQLCEALPVFREISQVFIPPS